MWRSIGARVRLLRRRLQLRQEDLAREAEVSRQVVQRIEGGAWDGMPMGKVQRVVAALGARLQVRVEWNGEQLDRLADAGHADLQNVVATMLRAAGWLVLVELSFNHYGDRGRYDLLAYHPATRLVLVVEIKTAIGDVQATLGTFDVKLRLAPMVARRQGWDPVAAIPTLVIADERQQHRIIAAHPALFERFSLRGRPARAWLKRPEIGIRGLLMYVALTNARLAGARQAARGQRIRSSVARERSASADGRPRSALADAQM